MLSNDLDLKGPVFRGTQDSFKLPLDIKTRAKRCWITQVYEPFYSSTHPRCMTFAWRPRDLKADMKSRFKLCIHFISDQSYPFLPPPKTPSSSWPRSPPRFWPFRKTCWSCWRWSESGGRCKARRRSRRLENIGLEYHSSSHALEIIAFTWSDKFPEPCNRIDVTIAYRSHRDNRPIKCLWHRYEPKTTFWKVSEDSFILKNHQLFLLSVVIIPLRDVCQTREDQHAHDDDEHEEAELLVGVLQGETQRLKTGDVSGQFEDAQDSHDAKDL